MISSFSWSSNCSTFSFSDAIQAAEPTAVEALAAIVVAGSASHRLVGLVLRCDGRHCVEGSVTYADDVSYSRIDACPILNI